MLIAAVQEPPFPGWGGGEGRVMIYTEPGGPLLVYCPPLHGTETENVFRNTTLRKTPLILPAIAKMKIMTLKFLFLYESKDKMF